MASSDRVWWLALLLSWLLLCVPVLLVEVPPMADYPNHLARMHILATIDHTPDFAANYVVHWGIVPDLAIDLFMPSLVSIVPPLIAGRILIAVILLLDVLGVTLCAAALHGRRTWWSLAGALVAYNTAFFLGFLNFNLATGLAMLGAGAWIIVRRQGRPGLAACLGMATSALLFFCHLMGLCFYLVLIGSSEFPAFLRALAINRPMPLRIWSAVARCWPLVLAGMPAPLLYAASQFRAAEGRVLWLGIHDKLMDLAAGFWSYDARLDGIVMLAVALVLAASRLCLARGGGLAFAIVLSLALVLPQDVKGTAFVATRPAIMAAFLLFIVPRPELPPGLRLPALLALAMLFCTRVAAVADTWHAYQTDVANMRALLVPVQPGDKVFQLDVSPTSVSDFAERAPKGWELPQGLTTGHHLGALAVLDRDALWSQLFADPVQQPLSPQPALATAIAAATRALPAGANPYCGFQWVLLFGVWADSHPASLVARWLALVSSNRTAALYRVDAETCLPSTT